MGLESPPREDVEGAKSVTCSGLSTKDAPCYPVSNFERERGTRVGTFKVLGSRM